jgi:hypothetical protein
MLRYRPDSSWPLLLAAVRDEFLDRPWDPPAAHWPEHPSLVGGRDQAAGGTWLAVRPATDPAGPAVAAVLNGVRLPAPALPRPSRGALPLAALTGSLPSSFDGYDGFHLVVATLSTVVVYSFDGTTLERSLLEPGDHIVVNEGVDATIDPLVPHFAPLLAATPDPPLAAGAVPAIGHQMLPHDPSGATLGDQMQVTADATTGTDTQVTETAQGTQTAWGAWVELLRGDGIAPEDPRALLVRKEFDGTEAPFAGRVYGSGSAALVALSRDQVRYDFTPAPMTPRWGPVRV